MISFLVTILNVLIDMVMKERSCKLDKLVIFTFLWTVASLFHLIAFYKQFIGNPFAWVTGLLSLLLLFKPRSVNLLALMLTCSVIKTFIRLPYTPNHILFELVINLGILVAYVQTIMADRDKKIFWRQFDEEDRKQFYRSFAPMARLGLIILYSFAVLAKLNWDFLNPEVSCGSWWLDVIRNNGLLFIPGNEVTQKIAIYGTVVVEAGIPLLLMFSKTRWWGIVLGIAFHMFLSLDPHVGMLSFCALLFALFFLFTPPDFPERLQQVYDRFRHGQKQTTRFVWFAGLLAVILIVTVLAIARYDHPLKYPPFAFWYVYASILIIILLTVRVGEKWHDRGGRGYFRVSGAMFLIPSILILNGLCPYVGIKTQTSFSMYSNLRTEGGITNHLFIPASLQIMRKPKDLVEILATDNKRLAKADGLDLLSGQRMITFFEFQRIASRANKDFYVDYIRNGKRYHLEVKNGISNQPEVTTPHHWLVAKLVQFRPIDKGPCQCKH